MAKKEEYVATRKDICAGKLIRIKNENVKMWDGTYEAREKIIAEQNVLQIEPFEKFWCRNILFNINENGLANDLIYTTPTNYLIEGIEPKIETGYEFVIYNWAVLEELLKYLNYGEYLTQSDLNKIYRILMNYIKWAKLTFFECLSGLYLPDFGTWKNVIFVKGKNNPCYRTDGILELPLDIADMLLDFYNGKPNPEEPNYSFINKRR